ncbi:MAG TPA: hypothetical protein VJ752_16175 [Burkholderiaceae bacterium]|nr:hypothetical protein [Burkholderiaceae bacterium]
MDFIELVFKRLDRRLTTNDYIDWADGLLVAGSDASSIAELASCSWEPNPDAELVERLFRSCVSELGLTIPPTWEDAFSAYVVDICNRVLKEEILPHDCLSKMIEFAEDDENSFIFLIWADLAKDLSKMPDEIVFNDVLDLKDASESIRQTASQFLKLYAMDLPARFPWVWKCKECGEVSNDDTYTGVLARTCPACKSAFALKNMRFFRNRSEFYKPLHHTHLA